MAGIGTIRAALKTAANGLTSGSFTLSESRVVLGYDDVAPSADFIGTIVSAGPYLSIRGGQLVGVGEQVRVPTYRITAMLYFGFARETDNDLTGIEGLLDVLRAAWAKPPIVDMSWSEPIINRKQSPVFGYYRIDLTAQGC